MLFLVKVWKCFLKIPVIFAHFPLPALMIVGLVAVVTGSFASCATHKLEASARAELKANLADLRAEYAGKLTKAAELRADTIQQVAAEKDAIARENQRAWFQALTSLTTSLGDKKALERLQTLVQELHNDPKFDCRRLPLPGPYLDGMRIEREAPRLTEQARDPAR
jgi:hypothetical protein